MKDRAEADRVEVLVLVLRDLDHLPKGIRVIAGHHLMVRRMPMTVRVMTSGAEAMGHKASEERVTRGRAGAEVDRVKDVALDHRLDSVLLGKAEVLVDQALAVRVAHGPAWTWILWLASTVIAFRCEASCWRMRLCEHVTCSTCV